MLLRTVLLAALCAPSALAAPTFAKDVWPIVQARCLGCHQSGEIAPMAFTSYRDTRPWAAAIREAVRSGAMPPWHALPNAAHAFRNDRALSSNEAETLVAWAEAGAPEGDPVRAFIPAPRTSAWKLGTPDTVVKIPGFQVPKQGSLPYSFLIVPLHLDHDVWVSAAEFRIDHSAVIHHINAFVRPPGSSYLAKFPAGQIFIPTVAQRGARRPDEHVFDRRELLLGYEPGYMPMPWLPDAGKLIKAGSDIVLEMHYNPNGTPVTDFSELALYFAKGAPSRRIVAIDTLRDLDLSIPPQQPDTVSRASMTLGQSATLLSIQPHMHMRGKSMAVRAIYPDGRVDPLLTVPRYDFHWQTTYVLRDPILLPAGTRLESVAAFDNSPNNAFNPDPAATVHWGDQTTDEMHIAFLELVIDASQNAEGLFQEKPKMIGTSPSSGQR
jgi:hypothetical protein